MDRRRLEGLSTKKLRREVLRYRLTPEATHEALVKQLVTHLESNGPLRDECFDASAGLASSSMNRADSLSSESVHEGFTTASVHPQVDSEQVSPQWFKMFADLKRQQEEMMVQFTQLVATVNRRGNDTSASPPSASSSSTDSSGARSSVPGRDGGTVMATMPTAQAVTLLASQIPYFSGSEDDNVDLWLQKVERVARIHGVADEVILLAVSSKLTKLARDWFDLNTAHKLKLLQNLNLPEKEAINFLISGITNQPLRGMATLMGAESTDKFLEQMHGLTMSYGDTNRRSPPPYKKFDDNKAKGPVASKEKSTDSSKDIFCVYCRTKGHLRADCFRLKKKEQAKQTSSLSSGAAVAVVEDSPSSSSTVALVNNHRLEVSDPVLKVVKFNDITCDIKSLLDSAINGTAIPVLGSIAVNIQLKELPDVTLVSELYVIKDKQFSADLSLGRDFILKNNLTVVYRPVEGVNDTVKLFSEVASAETVYDPSDRLESIITDINIDFDEDIKRKLITVIKESEESPVEHVDDGHAVTVALKDNSTYAYTPRRFAWSERIQIRDITDDLMRRGIIKTSISPYCARVVPVRKKNGTMRLCIDLRPLNERVVKQKYPFPLIEDCLARLGNKKVFSLLDLKDGFHQIKVHPQHTKYFAFATPDGQFEFTRLPFGFCEAPAEFQKRLIQIFQPLIRDDKVIVYIDDILIPSVSIEDNLTTLKQVLLLLKQYNFQLNFKKCLFLKKQIEYLGYILSPDGITISPRHTKAVYDFPQPRKMVEVQRFLGLTNYFRKFIKDTIKARLLQNLVRKSVDFFFDEDCLCAFQTLKEELISSPILRLYNPYAVTELHTDASAVALAAILFQRQNSGQWSPIAYYSQATNSAEAKYHSFELEMLAVLKAIERFHIYLYGLEFTLVTDCHALAYAINKTHLNPRIARWTLRLQNYRFKVVHRAGHKMAHVDALSRVAYMNALSLERELELKQLLDPRLREIAKQLEFSDNEKFELIEGLVYRKGPDKPRFAVPEPMIDNVIRVYHNDIIHCGIEKTVHGVSTHYWFPSLRKRVHEFIDNCLDCLMSNTSTEALPLLPRNFLNSSVLEKSYNDSLPLQFHGRTDWPNDQIDF
ncbi:uncharacterized protein [Linepithema humile]|uniref:uncharacterized protein n=1 Tax=Linepithema humile TaxID=83485 RepID=UPI00351DC73F